MKKFTLTMVIFLVLFSIIGNAWALDTDVQPNDIPQMPTENPALKTERGTQRPYEVRGGSYETQNARPIVIYRTNTRDHWAREEVRKIKEKGAEREKVWKKEIQANRNALSTGKKERGEIRTDITTLQTDVGNLKTDVGSLKTRQSNSEKEIKELAKKEGNHFIIAIITSVLAIIGVIIFLFIKK